jgi:hypothetical protein
MFDGEELRSGLSPGTASELELVDLLAACRTDRLLTLRGPVQSRVRGAGLPAAAAALFRGLPTLVAASNAPLLPPVYVFVKGAGFAGGLEKARKAP